MFVYKITCVATGKAYIGITTRKVKRRIGCHLADSKSGRPTAIARAIAKHGWAAFKVKVLYEASSKAELLVCERALIAAHGTFAPRGYNLTSGGDGCNHRKTTPEQCAARSMRAKKQHAEGRFPGRDPGWRPTMETRGKMAAAKRGKPVCQKTRDAVSRTHRGDNNVMRRRPDIVAAVAEKRRGVKRTPEQCARIAAGRRAAMERSRSQ